MPNARSVQEDKSDGREAGNPFPRVHGVSVGGLLGDGKAVGPGLNGTNFVGLSGDCRLNVSVTLEVSTPALLFPAISLLFCRLPIASYIWPP